MNKKILAFGILVLIINLLFIPTKVLAIDEIELTDVNDPVLSDSEIENDQSEATELDTYEKHTVAVIITKVDENKEPLKGATLQVIDSEKNIVDEWVSDGETHEIMLPEGEYILHEKEAPEGYDLAEDQSFTVEAIQNEINADTDHDSEICDHYGGIPLYYVEVEVESQGTKQKQEVYCINQGWEEPDGINYNGVVLTVDNITTFVPDYDKAMSNRELYDKVLDIIYHRSKAGDDFPELTNVEIRYITETALKNYTSAEYESPNGKDADGNYIMTKIFREYTYDPEVNSKYTVTPGEGDAIGNLAKHWWVYHKKDGKRVAIPSEYADLYYYLVRDDDHHPSDMYLYVYSTGSQTAEGDNYQNLLGVTWFNPYDDTHVVEVEMEDKYSTETIDISVEKIWDDYDDISKIRPEQVIVDLYADGEPIDNIVITYKDGWKVTIPELPKYNNGVAIEYTIEEHEIPEYEILSIINNENVFIITNHHELGKGNGPEEEPPQTGINYQNNGGILIVLFGAFRLLLILKKQEKIN